MNFGGQVLTFNGTVILVTASSVAKGSAESRRCFECGDISDRMDLLYSYGPRHEARLCKRCHENEPEPASLSQQPNLKSP